MSNINSRISRDSMLHGVVTVRSSRSCCLIACVAGFTALGSSQQKPGFRVVGAGLPGQVGVTRVWIAGTVPICGVAGTLITDSIRR